MSPYSSVALLLGPRTPPFPPSQPALPGPRGSIPPSRWFSSRWTGTRLPSLRARARTIDRVLRVRWKGAGQLAVIEASPPCHPPPPSPMATLATHRNGCKSSANQSPRGGNASRGYSHAEARHRSGSAPTCVRAPWLPAAARTDGVFATWQASGRIGGDRRGGGSCPYRIVFRHRGPGPVQPVSAVRCRYD